VHTKNGTATDEVTKQQVKVLEQQMSVTKFVQRNWYSAQK
jgi:hypothetical protein